MTDAARECEGQAPRDRDVEATCQVKHMPAEQSFGQVFRQARACDPHAFGRDFPDRWRDFLRAHFRSPLEVAFVFGVTERGAEKWWHGIGGPNGSKVALAFQLEPQAAVSYLTDKRPR